MVPAVFFALVPTHIVDIWMIIAARTACVAGVAALEVVLACARTFHFTDVAATRVVAVRIRTTPVAIVLISYVIPHIAWAGRIADVRYRAVTVARVEIPGWAVAIAYVSVVLDVRGPPWTARDAHARPTHAVTVRTSA